MTSKLLNAVLLSIAALLQMVVIADVIHADPCKTAAGNAQNQTAYGNPNCPSSNCATYGGGGAVTPCMDPSDPTKPLTKKCEKEREVFPQHYTTCEEVTQSEEHKCCELRYSKAHKVKCRCEAEDECTNLLCKVESVSAGNTTIGPYWVQLACNLVEGEYQSPCINGGNSLPGLDPLLTAVCPPCP